MSRPAGARGLASDARGRAWRLRCGAASVALGIALVAALVAALVWMRAPAPAFVPWTYLAAVGPWLAHIDVREHRLPNRLVLPGFGAWAIGAAWILLAGPDGGGAVVRSLLSGSAYALLLGALAWFGGMGGGDLKLGTLLGLALGLVSAPAAVLALPLAFGSGALAAAAAMAGSPKGLRWGRSIPFGPWLLLGAAVALGAAAVRF